MNEYDRSRYSPKLTKAIQLAAYSLELQNLWIGGANAEAGQGLSFTRSLIGVKTELLKSDHHRRHYRPSRSIASSPYNQGKALPLLCQYNRPGLSFNTSIAAIKVLNAQPWQLFEALLALSAPRVPLLDPSLPREHTPPLSAIQLGVMLRQADPQFQRPRHLPRKSQTPDQEPKSRPSTFTGGTRMSQPQSLACKATLSI